MSSSVSRKHSVGEAHAPGQQAEHFHVRFRLARRRQGGPRQLQMVVAVSEIKVSVLQERGGGQQDSAKSAVSF